jgi:diketogulonate reductase-like aldo/keto reductase
MALNTVTLNNGIPMPLLGLGVWQINSDAETERVVRMAIDAGYRSIDTAMIYGNERGVGSAIRACGIPRDQLFITTKVWNADIRRGSVADAFDESLERLGLDFIDLYLVHWAIPGTIASTWRAMESLVRSNRVKAIGVSNHLRAHLDELLPAAEIIPAVNQIEFHPYLQSRALVEYCRARKIQVEAWSPLMKGRELLTDPTIVKMAQVHHKTVAQIVLRWEIQSGIVTIPKSVHRARISENAAIFDFTLTDAEMKQVDALDQDKRVGPDPLHVSF